MKLGSIFMNIHSIVKIASFPSNESVTDMYMWEIV